MRGAYKKQSDVIGMNRTMLTQRNIMNEMFKFYREHLHPLNSFPSFRHTLMWAMQSQKCVLSWQFSFSGQMNWIAAEANWRLVMDPTAASKYDVIEAAAVISAGRRGARPGTLADDEYTGIDFMTVMMTAADQHEGSNAQRDEAENPDYFDGANAANSVPVVGEFDLSEFAVELEAVVGGGSDSEAEAADDDNEATAYGADPPGMYPSYRNAEANAMAEEESEEKFERPRAPRSRYIDDEAEDCEIPDRRAGIVPAKTRKVTACAVA